MNNVFKIAFLILGICLLLVLFGIYNKTPNNRFQMSSDGSTFLDTQTNEVYLFVNTTNMTKHKWFKMDISGQDIEVKELPK